MIRSTSVRMMEAAAQNCGLMIPQTPQLGGWLISSGAGSSYPGQYMAILVGDTLYFSAYDGSSGRELWAHDTSNASTWRVADINSGAGSSSPGTYMEILVGDTLYFSASDGSSGHELWAHDTSNASTWRVADIRSGTGSSNPGYYMAILVGDTLYFRCDMMEAAATNCGLMIPQTPQLGGWLISAAGLAAVPRILHGDTRR